MKRCEWAKSSDLDAGYHDTEWGVVSTDDRHLFEMLILEGAQAGLSWTTILKKRDTYRKAYYGFDPEKVARFTRLSVARLLKDPGIVRNRLKVNAAVTNAQAYLKLKEEQGSFDHYLWQFVNGRTIQNRWKSLKQIPTSTHESDAMSKALKKRGFKFVGTTICYAFMQAVGMVNDHVVTCHRHHGLGGPSRGTGLRPV